MLRSLAFVCFVVLLNGKWSTAEGLGDLEILQSVEEDPGEYGDLFEGDIMLPRTRNGNPSLTKRWPNGVMPYVIDSSVDSRGRSVLQQAFDYYRKNTCITLKQRTNEKDYVIFKTPASGCNSYVGKIGRGQTVNLAKGCFNSIGTVLHEILHALGFGHEMAREDRDQYINIHWDNIQDKYKFAFNVHKGSLTYGTKYDITSVMQYGSKAFSKNGQYTITPKNGDSPSKLGQRSRLTTTDLYKLKAMYNCDDTTKPVVTKKPVVTFKPVVTKSPPVTSDCINEHSNCDAWASRGECQNNPNYMRLLCKKACRVCKASATKCVDKHSNCASWSRRNPSECENNPRYMLYNCEQSCETCGARISCFNEATFKVGATKTSTLNSPQFCKRFCRASKFKYAGLKNGNICLCGNTYVHQRVFDSQCQSKCPGKSGMTCGGTKTVELYQV